MAKLQLRKASRKHAFLRMALYGSSGMGKTYTMLSILKELANGEEYGVIDSEMSSSEKYQGSESEGLFDFSIVSLGNPDKPDDISEYSPQKYIEALEIMRKAGIKWVGIDSATHAYLWALDKVETLKTKYKGNSYVAWRDVTPEYNSFIRYIVNSPMNIICTLRAKDQYVVEIGENGSKSAPKKIGLEPISRAGFEYEFDIVAQMQDVSMIITKTRALRLQDQVFKKPGKNVADEIKEWLQGGVSEEEDTLAKFIRRVVELQSQLIESGVKLDTSINLNTLTQQELTELGLSLKKQLDELDKD